MSDLDLPTLARLIDRAREAEAARNRECQAPPQTDARGVRLPSKTIRAFIEADLALTAALNEHAEELLARAQRLEEAEAKLAVWRPVVEAALHRADVAADLDPSVARCVLATDRVIEAARALLPEHRPDPKEKPRG